MTIGDRRIRKFNPGTFQSDEEVIEQFVVRERELDIVLEVLRGNTDSPSCQHVLVVAPRGRGKTMLLARVAAQVNTDDHLSESLLPVRFMEESHEIFNLADFWLDTLLYLARESARHDSGLAEELRQTHDDLANRWHEESLADRAHAAVLEAADRLGKKLLLMVENLQALCGNVDKDFGWKLRAVLQSEPQIMLVATATSRFEGLDDAEHPFFELFRIVALEPLATEECRRLWQVVSGDEVSKREIRPLEILTGGSPRLLVIVAGFAQHRSLRQLMEELVELIDEHTEYFRGHLEVLAKGERRVYIAVIDLWRPSRTGEIAARARMDVRTVSTLLGRLVIRGAVIVEGSGKKRMYAAAERLYSIYYKLRRERDEAAIVANLIHFLVAFYEIGELYQMSEKLITEAEESKVIREGIERAVAETPQIANAFSKEALSSIGHDIAPVGEISGKVRRLLTEIVDALEADAFEKAVELVDRAIIWRKTSVVELSEPGIAALLVVKGIAQQSLGNFEAAIATYEKIVEHYGAKEDPQIQGSIAVALVNKGCVLGKLGELDGSISTFEEVVARFGTNCQPDLQPRVVGAQLKKGNTLEKLTKFPEAIATYDEVIERFGDSKAPYLQIPIARALSAKIDSKRQFGEHAAAIDACEELVARHGTDSASDLQVLVAYALSRKGEILRKRDELGKAIATYDEVVERFGISGAPELQLPVASALDIKGDIQRLQKNFLGAMSSYNKVVVLYGDSDAPELQIPIAGALSKKGDTLRQEGDFAGAISVYEEVVARYGDSEVPELQVHVAWALVHKGDTQRLQGDPILAITTYDELVARFGASDLSDLQLLIAWALFNKGDTQIQLGDFPEAIAACDEIIDRFGSSDAPTLQYPIALAWSRKSMQQIEIGRAQEALNTCGELELRLGALTENEKNEFTWRTACVGALALMVQKNPRAAMETFRSAYSVFVPSDKTMMHEMLRIVPHLIANGASAHDLVEILSGDGNKSGALVPLVVALRQHVGEAVPAPAEVLEVAADIRKRIEATAAKAVSVAH